MFVYLMYVLCRSEWKNRNIVDLKCTKNLIKSGGNISNGLWEGGGHVNGIKMYCNIVLFGKEEIYAVERG
jgi:hypothetical protein